MVELKPCPFCGGEARKVYRSSGGTTHIECTVCRAQFLKSTCENAYDDAWNTRAERTCKIVTKDNLGETDGDGDVWHECTSCHRQWDYGDLPKHGLNYCPGCGARIERGES